MSDEKKFSDWLKRAHKSSKEGLEKSSVYAGLVTGNFLEDPLCALQLGLAIMMNKPIFLVIKDGEKVPESLMRIAKGYTKFSGEKDMDRVALDIKEFASTLGGK